MEENSLAKRCEICGEIKPIEAFSKSYKNRCKDCVAEQARENRRAEKEFNEIRKVRQSLGWDKNDIDWEQVRIQAAIAAMQGVLSNPAFCNISTNKDFPTTVAIYSADKLVEKLKKEK